jgi:hypothetical protein
MTKYDYSRRIRVRPVRIMPLTGGLCPRAPAAETVTRSIMTLARDRAQGV